MPLEYEPIDIGFAGGIDTKTDTRLVQPPKVLDLVDWSFGTDGGLEMRRGYDQIEVQDLDGTTLTAQRELYARGTELVGRTADTLYAYSSTQDAWIERGEILAGQLTTEQIADSSSSQTNPTVARTSDFEVFAWDDSRGGVYYCVRDLNGVYLQPPAQLSANAARPQALALGGNALIVWIDTAASDIKTTRISRDSFSGSTRTLSLNDVHGDYLMDATVQEDYAAVGYKQATTEDLVVFQLQADGNFGPAISQTVATTVSGFLSATHLTAEQKTVFLYGTSSTTDVSVFPPLLGAPTTFTILSAVASQATVVERATSGSNQVQYFFERSAAAAKDHYIQTEKATDPVTAPAGSPSTFIRHAGLAGHAVRKSTATATADDEWYLPVVHESTLQSSFYLLNSDAKPVSRWVTGEANGLVTGVLPHPAVESSVFRIVCNDKKRLDALSELSDSVGAVYTDPGIVYAGLDFSSARAPQGVSFRDVLFMGGGLSWEYDGDSPVESGFLMFPEGVTFSTSNTASGGLSSAQSYAYRVYWEWYDTLGRRIQSTFVKSFTIGPNGGTASDYDALFTTGSDDTVTLTVDTLPFTHKQGSRSAPVLAVYRTEGDPADGALYYRIQDPTDATANDPSADTVSVVDTVSDAALISGELDYQNTGELDNVPAPAHHLNTATFNRVFLVDDEKPRRVWYSKTRSETQKLAFNEALTFDVEPTGGDITALGSYDDRLVIFKRDRVYVAAGAGRTNFNTGANYVAERVSSDVGCTEHRSVVTTPQGVMFKSEKGFYLLDRNSAQTVYIGRDVESYNDQTVTGASLVPKRNQVRFLTDSGRTLVWDYLVGAWTTFSNHTGLAAVVINGTYYYLRTNGTEVYAENDGYSDAGVSIAPQVEMAWLRPGGPQGYFKVRRMALLGEYLTDHKLRMEVSWNYKNTVRWTKTFDPSAALNTSTWGDQSTWGADSAWGGSKDGVYQYRHRMGAGSKGQAVKFKFTVLPGNNPGGALKLTALAIEVGAYGGLHRLPKGKTI